MTFPTLMKPNFITCLTLAMLLSNIAFAQSSHIGAFYSFGASFNSHQTNDHKFRPSDGSKLGLFYHLDNGGKALGFKASFAWRSDDIEFPVIDHFSVINNSKSFELKLQCMLPISIRSSVGLGMAPRLVFHSKFSRLYYNSGRRATYEEQFSMTGADIDINALNSAVCVSWYFNISKHFQFALHLDQDMLPLYRSNAQIIPDGYEDPIAYNARLTCLTGALLFQLR